MRKLLSIVTLLLAWLILPGGACAQAFSELQAETTYLDNLSRSEFARDAREDLVATVTARGGLHMQPGTYTGLTLTAFVARAQHRRYAGLSNAGFGASAEVSRKLGLGERQPILAASITIERNAFNLDIRDAWVYRASLSWRKRVTDLLRLDTGFIYEQHNGDYDRPRATLVVPRSGAPWDQDSRAWYLSMELDLNEAMWLDAAYTLQDGDVVSSATPYAKILNAATAITLDPQFGPATVAYRIDARTQGLSLGLNRAVLRNGTIYAAFEIQQTRGVRDIDYGSGLVRAGYIHAF